LTASAAPRVVGVLLAAGRGERFGGDKLLAKARIAAGGSGAGPADLAGECIGVAACRHLLAALPKVYAVVRADDHALAAALGAAGAQIVRCVHASEGMGASIACGVAAAREAPRAGSSHSPTCRGSCRRRSHASLLRSPTERRWLRRFTKAGAGTRSDFPLRAMRNSPRSVATRVRRRLSPHMPTSSRTSLVDDPGTLRDIDTPDDLTFTGDTMPHREGRQ
jgi:molybdenum cofactor cytidylyltransferase